MILYLDTSALVKRYFQESHSDEIDIKWQEAAEITTSSVAYAEALAAFYRKKRESSLNDRQLEAVLNTFRTDWSAFIRIQVTDDLQRYIDSVLNSHLLRGFDALHLSSAMVLHELFGDSLLFACFDQRLTQAAKSQGIQTYPD